MADDQIKDQTPAADPPNEPEITTGPSAARVGASKEQQAAPTPDAKPQTPAQSAAAGEPSADLADPLAGAYDYEDTEKGVIEQPSADIQKTPETKPQAPAQSAATKPDDTIPVPEVNGTGKPLSSPAKSKIKAPPTQAASKQPVGSRAVIRRSGSRFVKIIVWILAVLAVLGIAFYLFFYRVTLTINPTPTPDSVTLDGTKIDPGTYRINPGQHELIIKKQGYVSYYAKRKFNIAEKINLNFQFEKQIAADSIAEGGKNVVLSSDKKFLIYQGSDNKLYSLKFGADNKPAMLSTDAYEDIRSLLISNDNLFALILDKNALRLVDFMRQDLINQTQTVLPPLASAINDVTWNSVTDSFFPEVNANVIYDLKSDYGWDLILANRTHTQSEILMQLDSNRFSNVHLDWSTNPKQVLIAGGEVGIIDLPSRSYIEVARDMDIASAKWSPTGAMFATISRDGKIYGSRDTTLSELGINGQLYNWTGEKELTVIDGSRPQVYNFDTGEVINYAEIKGLDSCRSFTVAQGTIYFADREGVESAPLQLPSY